MTDSIEIFKVQDMAYRAADAFVKERDTRIFDALKTMKPCAAAIMVVFMYDRILNMRGQHAHDFKTAIIVRLEPPHHNERSGGNAD